MELEITSETDLGRVIRITDQSVVFGRSDAADIVLRWDEMISSRHFQVRLDGKRYYIIDLHSTNGTFVNGHRTQASRLVDGDQIDAGRTCFTVRIPYAESDEPEQIPEPGTQSDYFASDSRSYDASSQRSGTLSAPISGLVVINFTCGSGLTRIRGTIPEDVSITEILERLCDFGSIYFMIDFSRIGLPIPPEVDIADSSLFSWLPREAASQTPQVVSMAEIGDWKIFLEEGWGCDAIVCLQSDLEKKALKSELSDLAFGSAKPGTSSVGVTGFCWPSVISAMLENDMQGFTQKFMKIANLVVTEVAGEAEGWQLFGSEETVENCRRLRLTL